MHLTMFFLLMTVNRAHEEGDSEEDCDGDDNASERSRDRISEFPEFFSKVVHGSFLLIG